MTTLTREALQKSAEERTKPHKTEALGFGEVWVRRGCELKRLTRENSYYDDRGRSIDSKVALRRIHRIVDCVLNADGSQMFSDEDVEMLSGWDDEQITALYVACLSIEPPKKNEAEES